MDRKYDVICLGFVCQDVVMTGIRADALQHDSTVANEVIFTSGGDANNQAVTLARLGSKTALLAKLGTDAVSNSIYEEWKKENLDLSLIIRDDKAKINFCVCAIMPSGERSFLVGKGNKASSLTLNDINTDILKETKAITVGSLFTLMDLDGEGIAEIFRRAREYNTITICDMATDMMGIGPDAIKGVCPYTDYMMPSLEEATYVTGETDPDKIADKLLSYGVKTVILKLGGEGCFVKNKDLRFFFDPYDIKPVDTTGCGDNFLAAFTHYIVKGKSLYEAIEFASATGALNATGFGAHLTVKSEAQVLEFMKTHKQVKLNRD